MSVFFQMRFVASAPSPAAFPPDDRPEIAFAGRSNVGKSSAINALANRRRLAIASRTPGRTRTINFFALGECARLADLPGYGYAAVPRPLRAGWEELVGAYFARRRSLAAVVMLMDVRHPLTALDRQLLGWLRPRTGRLLVLLAKSDRVGRQAALAAQAGVREALRAESSVVDILLFSAKRGDGVREARALLEQWIGGTEKTGPADTRLPAPNKKPPAKGKATGGKNALNGFKATRSGRRSGRRLAPSERKMPARWKSSRSSADHLTP
jgi:GTP-binding protein